MIQSNTAFIFTFIQSVTSMNILTEVSFATFTDTFQSRKINGCDGDVLVIDCPLQYEVTAKQKN